MKNYKNHFIALFFFTVGMLIFCVFFKKYYVEHGGPNVVIKKIDFSDYSIRKATMQDEDGLYSLYQRVASVKGGLARTTNEITQEYISKILYNGVHKGIAFVVEHDHQLIGSMIKYRLEPKVFSHVLTEGSILIDPSFQGQGIGTILIKTFLQEILDFHQDVMRVEIVARESNPAIALYEKLGFVKEGRFENRIQGISGKLEADIPMVWINSKYKRAY